MLKATFLDKKFDSPLILASGILGVTGASLARTVANGCGGVTTKSISQGPRTGHPNPTMMATEHFFINAVGLSNPGTQEAIQEIKKYQELSKAPLIASIFAGTPSEFVTVAKEINQAPIDFLEVNLSCPNVSKEFGEPFAYSHEAIENITTQIKQISKVPIIIKLTPQAWNIGELAKTAAQAGADALNIGNTISGMTIDHVSRQPILYNKQGGVSGPAIFPIALKAVYDTYQAVDIPIIGTGGVTTGQDAINMILAGATLVGIGSAVYYRGQKVFDQINKEIKNIMNEQKIKSLTEIIGTAHK